MRQAANGNELHQWLISPLIEDDEPNRAREQRNDQDRTVHGQTESQNTSHRKLKDDQADYDTIAYDRPCFTGGMLTVIHCVEELIFVDEGSDDEI